MSKTIIIVLHECWTLKTIFLNPADSDFKMNKFQDINTFGDDPSDNHFTIVADETGQIETIIALIIQKIMQTRANKLVFIDYGNNSELLNNLSVRLKELWRDETFCPNEIFIPDLKSKSISEVKSLVSGYSESDVVILFSCTNILSAQTQHGVSMTKGGLSFQIGSFCGLNWKEFRDKVLSIRSSSNSNIFFHISIDKDCHDVLMSTFKDDEVDIYNLSNNAGEIVTTQKMINDIHSLPFSEAYAEVESLKSKLNLNSYLSLRVMLYMHYYRYSEALNLLDEHCSSLNSDLKKLLADLHSKNAEGGGDRALEILAEIHDDFPNTRGLYESISRVVLENDPQDGQRWMDICLIKDPDNIKVIDCAANFYNRKERYANAEKLRRKLFREISDLRQLLLAEILSILKDGNVGKHEAEERIKAFAEKHKDNLAICDECYYRLGLLWIQKYNSSFKAFQSLLGVSNTIDNDFAANVARLKLETLSDLVAQKKADSVKPGKYADLPSFFVAMLISSIPALTIDKAGFGIWRDYIEKVQDFPTWEKSLASILPTIICQENTQSIHQLSEKSYYLSNPQITQEKSSIFFARLLRLQDHPEEFHDQLLETIDQVIDFPEGLLANVRSPIEECFVRYQLAIIASDRGKTQFAQNQALHLWIVANQADEEALSMKARVLGLIAWGYGRLRSGDSIEGVACLLSSVRLAIECEEVGPLIEDGYRTLLYWASNSKMFTEEQKVLLVKHLRNPWQPEYREYVNSLLCQQKWEELYAYLSKHMIMDGFDSEWALDFLHYVQASFHSGHRKETNELIFSYHKKFIRALEGRKNIRPPALSAMAQMILMDPTKNSEKRFKLAKLLLDQAINDLELHRSQFFHKEERALWLDKNRPIYSDHAVNTVACASMCQPETPQNNLLNAMNRVTARSLIENRQSLEDPSPELVALQKEYQDLLEDYTRASASGVLPQDMDRENLERFKEIQDIILKEHPFYRPLPLVDELSEEQLRENIGEDEVLYQVVIGKMWSASMIVTRDEISFDIIHISRDEVLRHVEIVSKYMLSIPKYNTLPNKNVLSSIKILSKSLFGSLSKFISKNNMRRVFLCKDVSLGMFSSSLIKVDGGWLFERVESIHNIVSSVELIQKMTMASQPQREIKLFLFGPNTDSAISKISAWQQRPDISQVVTLDTLDIKKPDDEIRRLMAMRPYIAFIAGHGVHDTNRLGGAAFVKGKKEMISARDLSPIIKTCECAIVLSCSGGTPIASQPESGEGIWAGMVGMGAKGTVLCAWDVDAKATLGVIEYLLQNERSNISSSLCKVKRGMIENKKYANPYFWAGLEYWGVM